MAKLTIESGEGRGQKYRIGGSVFIGRSPKNQIPIDDSTISRRHTKISFANGRFTVVDLGSKNGTFVNETIAKEPTPLKTGDRIRIGKNVILFTEEAPKPAAAVAAPVTPEPSQDLSGGLPPMDYDEASEREIIVPVARRSSLFSFALRFAMGAILFAASAVLSRELFIPLIKQFSE